MPRKPGKYDAVLDGKPSLPFEDDPRRQALIDELKNTLYKDNDATSLATKYGTIRIERELLKAKMSVLQLHLDALMQMLIESQDEGTDPAWGAYGAYDNAIRLPNGDNLRVNKEPASKVVDPEAFRRWCIENGYENKLQLHAGTREQIVAERILAGDPAPEGVEVGSWTKLTFTAAKEKAE